jgi:hypothetical protein
MPQMLVACAWILAFSFNSEAVKRIARSGSLACRYATRPEPRLTHRACRPCAVCRHGSNNAIVKPNPLRADSTVPENPRWTAPADGR